jgi:hypothetical protein
MAAVFRRSLAPAPPSGSGISSSWSTPAWTPTAAFARRAFCPQRDGRPSRLPGRVHARAEPSGASGRREGVCAGGRLAAVHLGNRARGRPCVALQAGECIRSALARLGPRPVIRGGRAAVPGVPGAYRFAHPFARPFPRGRAGVAFLAVFVRVALAVARAGRRAAASAGTPVASLDLACLLASGVLRA